MSDKRLYELIEEDAELMDLMYEQPILNYAFNMSKSLDKESDCIILKDFIYAIFEVLKEKDKCLGIYDI